MAFFEVGCDRLQRLTRVSLAEVAIHERRDFQRLLRGHVAELMSDVLVISEEFGDWDDSKRRIDLLGVHRSGALVVIELKRGDTGAHMELQAIRYAAMVSTMTFEQAVVAFEHHLVNVGATPTEARQRLLDHLAWSEPNEDDFAQDVRIVLFSEDFSRELTTSILWLNERRLDITCFRVGAYRVDQRLLLEFQQIIPLKEAEDYQVRVRNKQQVEETARRAQVPWNKEYYANYGDLSHRCWDDARNYGFISAGGGSWFSRTLNLLEPGGRVWVNSPGVGYLGVGVVRGRPVPAREFEVSTSQGMRKYLDVGRVSDAMRATADDPERTEYFVPVEWIATVSEAQAVRETGLFGNQNSAAKPKSPDWPTTVDRLKAAFKVD
ncbi:hypothetical protein DWG18_10620 [Lysobacter sp. TY2-98]|uniref:hypothetical protein n=1 Tax=Lysobacter sp. TY2-98 TaxID=2290922 RepID=UPI000E1FB911|nr:hypothetical protein [Lysobacter sp. TY2-98]AXK72682.1 hypothetical protein DWG18_10620 [Lysobacter sp. TY2-98]